MRDFTSHHFMDDATSNPFLEDLFIAHPSNIPGVAQIHQAAFTQVHDAVEQLAHPLVHKSQTNSLGRLFLITAPDAGYGKSHLVGRLCEQLDSITATLTLPFDRSRPTTWPVVLTSILRQFSSPLNLRKHEVTVLEEFSRYLLSRLVLEAIAHEVISPRECPVSPDLLREDYVILFSSDSNAKMLRWMDKHSAGLLRRTDSNFSQSLGMGSTELSFWIRMFLDLNLKEKGALERLRGLSAGEAKERLLQLLRLATYHRPVMLVADGLDGFHHSESAGMEITEILNSIREKVPHSVTLLCLNDDVWSSVFSHQLPSAWLDRLNGERVRLQPIGHETASELVRFRLRQTPLTTEANSRFISDLAGAQAWTERDSPLTPRQVLRQAATLWQRDAEKYLSLSAEENEEGEGFGATLQRSMPMFTERADFPSSLPTPEEHPSEERAKRPTAPPPLPPLSTPVTSAPVVPTLPVSTPSAPTTSTQPVPTQAAPTPVPAPAPVSASTEALPTQTAPGPATSSDRVLPDQTTPTQAVPPSEATPTQEATPPLRPSSSRATQQAHLAGIDSIINDIRGTGNTAVSEPSEAQPHNEEQAPPPSAPAAPAAEPAPIPQAEAAPAPPAEDAASTPRTEAPETPPSFFTGLPPNHAPRTAQTVPLTRASIEKTLSQRERELLTTQSLSLNLERLARFIRSVGAQHPALGQEEERYPSSQSVCLRWNVRGYSVLSGFESPQNTYFWNNLLRQSLSSNRQEKITAFSHTSQPFDPALFSSFGFSPSLVRSRVDIIQMNDRELAMIYAAELTLRDFENTSEGEKAAQLITLYLDPLWRRIIHPL